jgi:6-phosphofructokinase 1
MVIETMGRKAGWIACLSGIAVAADYILVPEVPVNVKHMFGVLRRRRAEGKEYGLVVVSEGAELPEAGEIHASGKLDDFDHPVLGGIGEIVAKIIDTELKIETRSVTLGHLQRGGPPSAYDRVLASRFGIKAAELVLAQEYGNMSALKGNDIVVVPLKDAVAKTRTLDLRYYEEAKEFFPESAT